MPHDLPCESMQQNSRTMCHCQRLQSAAHCPCPGVMQQVSYVPCSSPPGFPLNNSAQPHGRKQNLWQQLRLSTTRHPSKLCKHPLAPPDTGLQMHVYVRSVDFAKQRDKSTALNEAQKAVSSLRKICICVTAEGPCCCCTLWKADRCILPHSLDAQGAVRANYFAVSHCNTNLLQAYVKAFPPKVASCATTCIVEICFQQHQSCLCHHCHHDH